MPSRPLDLFRPRSLALLLAGLAGSALASRTRSPAQPPQPERPAPPYPFPAPFVAVAVMAVCGVFTAAWLGWVAYRSHSQQRAVAIALTRGDPDRAPALMVRFGCAGCHTIPGIPGAYGKVAAPLTGMRARVYVAGVLPNTADNLIAWIVDPPAYSPRTAMPVTGITEAEARDVASYLYSR